MQRMTRLRWMTVGAAVFAGALVVALAVGLTATAQVFPPAEQTLPEATFRGSNSPSRGFVQPLPTMEAVRTFVLVDGTEAITETLVSDSPLLDAANRDASATTGYAVRITEGVTQTWVFLRLDFAWPANTQYLALV